MSQTSPRLPHNALPVANGPVAVVEPVEVGPEAMVVPPGTLVVHGARQADN